MKTRSIAFIIFMVIFSITFFACAKDKGAVAGAKKSADNHASCSMAHADDGEHYQVVKLTVTSDGFVPDSFKVKSGKEVKLIVTRKVENTCARDIVIKDFKISESLPLDKPVELIFTPANPGKVRFACSMNHIFGEIEVE